MDLIIRWSTTVRNRRVPILVFVGTLANEDRDKEMTIMVLLEYRVWANVTRMLWGLLGHFDRQTLFPLFFWSTRNHSSLVKSTYEEHLRVVAMTSSERGTQFHPLASYRNHAGQRNGVRLFFKSCRSCFFFAPRCDNADGCDNADTGAETQLNHFVLSFSAHPVQ